MDDTGVASMADDPRLEQAVSDIVQLLNNYDTPARYPELITEAADEIERLRATTITDEMVKRAAEAISLSFHEEGYIEGHSDPAEWDEFLKAARAALVAALTSNSSEQDQD
jgi:malic enzyme